MNPEQIAISLREQVADDIEIEEAGPDDFTVHVPFRFDDGDHFVAILRKDAYRQWYFTDEGHTLMHLSYTDKDSLLRHGKRRSHAEKVLSSYGLTDQDGELVRRVQGDYFADALFAFIQGVGRFVGIADWTREQVKDTFREDFQDLIQNTIPADRLHPDFKDEDNEVYRASYRIDARRPYLVFAVASDSQCLEAAISIRHFLTRFAFSSMAIYRDQTDISRRHVAMLSDVVGKQFSSLHVRDQIIQFLKDEVLAS